RRDSETPRCCTTLAGAGRPRTRDPVRDRMSEPQPSGLDGAAWMVALRHEHGCAPLWDDWSGDSKQDDRSRLHTAFARIPRIVSVWFVFSLLALAGAAGGLVNAFLAREGFVIWRTEHLPNGETVWRPGFLGNVAVGAITALVLAGLYSPLALVPIGAEVGSYQLTVGGLMGALLSGIGGARLLTNEVNRRFEGITREQLTKALEEWSKAKNN